MKGESLLARVLLAGVAKNRRPQTEPPSTCSGHGQSPVLLPGWGGSIAPGANSTRNRARAGAGDQGPCPWEGEGHVSLGNRSEGQPCPSVWSVGSQGHGGR